VSLAYIAEMGAAGRAERLGIFGMSRSASYLIAPVIGASLLTVLPPEQVFTLIGLVSCAALLPALGLPEVRTRPTQRPAPGQVIDSLRGAKAIWLIAALEMITYVATYALKAFLPIYALRAMGLDLILIGLFFTLQEAVHLVVRPFAGRLADRVGTQRVILFGLCALTLAFAVLGFGEGAAVLFVASSCIGIGLAMILPATLSMLTAELRSDALGAGMGVLGALRNLAKVIGPVLAGLVLMFLPYQSLFLMAACLLGATALGFGLHGMARRTRQAQGS
jgi:MFS family permease